MKLKIDLTNSNSTRAFSSNHKHPQFLVVWRFWEPSSSSARELQAFFSELLTVFNLHRHSSSEAIYLSLYYGLRISPERTVSIFLFCCIFSCSLWALVLYFFTLSGSLVSFCNLSFSSVVLSLEHMHSLCSEIELVRVTLDQKLALVPCAARTGLVPQHLIKITGWLSSGLWKIGLERLSPDQK